VNQVRDEDDEEAGSALATSFRKCFGLELPIAGLVQHDPSVLQAVHKRRPLSQQFPNTLATKGMARAVGRLMAAAPQGIGDPAEEWLDLGDVDHYRVLEIDPKASPKEVQTAYQVMKKAYDPELTHLSPLLDLAGLQAIQARVEESYRTLIFLESRVTYDKQMLETGSLKADQVRGLHAAATSGEAAPVPVPAPDPELQAAKPQGAPECSGPPAIVEDRLAPAVPPAAEPGPAATEVAPAAPGSGAALRAERLRLGQTLEAIASRTKIRQTYLLAIEEDRFDALPPPVFLRGFVREFAACLGLAGDETARAYLLARERAQGLAAPPGNPGTRRSA
jgi:flagellar biosynthesis protein FlhG